jgi:hypothetical protein
MSIRPALVLAGSLLAFPVLAQDATRDGERVGARIGAGVGEVVGGAVEGAGRIVDDLTAPRPRETIVIERQVPVAPVPCVRTADGRRVCEGD